MNWYISDTHFGHANIINLCERPFKNVEEMDEKMIHLWNMVVHMGDTVYHLGDFTLGNFDMFYHYVTRLNGSIRILSNPTHHDKRWLKQFDKYDIKSATSEKVGILPAIFTIEEHGKKIVMCHFPMEEWEGYYHGAIHIHGHVHNAPFRTVQGRVNVSADETLFYPASLGHILAMVINQGGYIFS